jgi:hypothetical protein
MAAGYRVTQALYVMAKLGVADLLAESPKTSEELERRLDVQSRPLFRVMRFLASEGVFTQDASDRFGLTPFGEPLRTDHPETVRHSVIMHGELHYQAAGALLHTVRTGETGFDHLYGKGMFDYLSEHPEDSATFNAAMANSAGVWENPPYEYNFRGRKLLVDVGGGRGHLIASLLERNPLLRGFSMTSLTDSRESSSRHRGGLSTIPRAPVSPILRGPGYRHLAVFTSSTSWVRRP